MRKVIKYVLISADGVFEDPVAMGVGEYQDEAYLQDGLGVLTACDAILFGRRTYEAFAELYDGRTYKLIWADRLNAIPKYVFSSTLEKADWTNSTVVRGDAVAEVARLKQQEGGDRQAVLPGRPERQTETRIGEELLENRKAELRTAAGLILVRLRLIGSARAVPLTDIPRLLYISHVR
jgi:hypothetical protein